MLHKLFLFVLILIFVSLCLMTISCSEDESDFDLSNFTGITETDDQGNFIGFIDTNDWAGSYDNVYFGNNFWLYPKNDLFFCADSINQIITKQVRFFNSGDSNIDITTSVSLPFYCDITNFTIEPLSLYILNVNCSLPDSSSYTDTLLIQTSNNENININVEAHLNTNGNGYVPPPNENIFHPTYPNPASEGIALNYSIMQNSQVNVKIVNQDGYVVRAFAIGMSPAGSFSLLWDSKDSNGIKVNSGLYRAFLEVGDYESHGDILIE